MENKGRKEEQTRPGKHIEQKIEQAKTGTEKMQGIMNGLNLETKYIQTNRKK